EIKENKNKEENSIDKQDFKDISENKKEELKIQEIKENFPNAKEEKINFIKEKNLEKQDIELKYKEQNIIKKEEINQKQNTKQEQPKVSFGTKLRGVFSKEIAVKESDIEPFLEDLRISLLESDVNLNASEKIISNIKNGLLSNKILSKNIDSQISNILKSSIQKILETNKNIDLIEMAQKKKIIGEPFKILFIGPNGAGKTTTMAKIANLFIKNSFSVVLSASDTFRAAAIEQTAIHADRLHIGVIKGKYGADPASVAFDAVAHAKAHHINIVLIDSAGRQETNKSLMEEIKKIVRITKPDIKIFVGESITGNSLLEQVTEFNKSIGLDGIILTKLDCDAKGGNTLSILSETSVPVIFFGVGEGYDDLINYDPIFIIKNMIAN
ncbi:MAG: signal recognition particle-docking protein FtsY, partial [Candidatus Micrarchaeaceae archaeon]